MKLDVTCMRYLKKDDYRVLTAIEMGMRNHALVPVPLIVSISKLRHGGSHKILSTLLRHKLVAHEARDYNGYRLSYLGYDILALRTLLARGIITSVGSQIGIGKESDIFEALNESGDEIVLKIHRLGRTSFRAVRNQRDYMENKSKTSWLYMSRLAAMKEFAFMTALHSHGFPTPIPYENSRHIVAMSRVRGFPMAQIKTGQMDGAEQIFVTCASILHRLAEHGLIHCDFNEFNLMVDNDGLVTMIDFPQMVSTDHPNASDLFDRDMNGLIKFFAMKMRFVPSEQQRLRLEDIERCGVRIDEEVRAGQGKGTGSGEGSMSQMDDDTITRFLHEPAEFEESNNIDDGVCDEDDDDDDHDDDEGLLPLTPEKDFSHDPSVYPCADNPPPPPPASPPTLVELDVYHDSEELDVLSVSLSQNCIQGETAATAATAGADEEVCKEKIDDNSDIEDTNDNTADCLSHGERNDVRNAIKREIVRTRSKTSSRNHTKKRNKYGKIDRADRASNSSMW